MEPSLLMFLSISIARVVVLTIVSCSSDLVTVRFLLELRFTDPSKDPFRIDPEVCDGVTGTPLVGELAEEISSASMTLSGDSPRLTTLGGSVQGLHGSGTYPSSPNPVPKPSSGWVF
ncbi:hypothetical protein HS088_TW23G00595 [Tripterygium wilfordii]|uniref:Uncharacterized protein n=1 Tax=Tripterygium wilfordii TaxID=458696 RepID=A0A7J7BW00_TRIWF|nr:hypothetical protein HS088_TW23G00595 [Tripterygium wilfordii]